MNKEEYLKQEEVDFDNLDLENARRLAKFYNYSARTYFGYWQKALKENMRPDNE